MDLLTWNLGLHWKEGKFYGKARDAACMHLSKLAKRKKPFVAAFQECWDYGELAKMVPGANVYGAGTHALVSSFPLSDGKTYERFVATRINMGGNRLVIVNYHGWDQRNRYNAAQRGGAASEFRWLIDEYCGNDDAIIMGDFNATPADVEIFDRWCFGFSQEHRQSHGRNRTGFSVIRPGGTEMVDTGTLYWSSPETTSKVAPV